ncbi:hypothetical protein EZH22_26010 [Xanthobacter dioxanivorans]|uniref:Uncharacterized protein n=1 Tax=Xanthobacter dioxanivorans TaxID=2528964 RepID=A0A974SIF0_9HYPH|nr:hypothetical protein [Xanthobacter dioxanivorans]QRG06367.1 hypothetical protein EZH22_26010 [Xanthobacter dioxanivorans]
MDRKIVVRIAGGLAVLVVLSAAGWFGFLEWTRAKVRSEVDAAFAALRETGAKASFTDASFDPRERAVTVSGISIVSPEGGASLKIARLFARGGERPHDRRVSVEALDVDGLEVALTGEAAAGGTVTYTLPKVMIDQYTGPMTLIAAGEGDGPFGALRVALRQIAATTAAKVTIPEVKGRIVPAGAQPVEVNYSEIAAEGVNAGTIRSLIVDRVTFAFTPPSDGADRAPGPVPGRISGRIDGIVAARIDTAPLLAATNPPGATSAGMDNYGLIYGKVVTGPYVLTQDNGPRMRAASLLMEQVGIRPSAFDAKRTTALRDLQLKSSSQLTPDERRRALDLSRDIIDGIAFRTLAASGVETEQDGQKGRIASMRIEGLAASVIDEVSLEGMEGAGAGGAPGKVGRFAIRRLDLNQLSRLAAEQNAPSPVSALMLFKLFSGIELSGVEVPYGEGDARNEPVKIGAFALSWGGSAGALPTRLDLALTDVSGPIRADDGEPFTYLAAAGIKRATVSFALKAAYDASARTLTVAPATAEVKEAFRLSVESAIGDVPPAAFSDATGFISALPTVAAGPVKVTLTDLGLARLMFAQLAASEGVSEEEYRRQVVEMVESMVADLTEAAPDAADLGSAVVAFVRQPGTLTVTATPKERVPLLALAAAFDPSMLLEAFSFTATASAP